MKRNYATMVADCTPYAMLLAQRYQAVEHLLFIANIDNLDPKFLQFYNHMDGCIDQTIRASIDGEDDEGEMWHLMVSIRNYITDVFANNKRVYNHMLQVVWYEVVQVFFPHWQNEFGTFEAFMARNMPERFNWAFLHLSCKE